MQIFETGALFEQVQMEAVLEDGKTFPDCLPKMPLEDIVDRYEAARTQPDFRLKDFILAHFGLPSDHAANFVSDPDKAIDQHIHDLWPVLTRQPDSAVNSSLIPLPHPYIVPGGRFREIYYWDSYFTMLGLKVSGRVDMIEHMVQNFAALLDQVGHIPNGNRTYYIGRSQPPFFALMVQLLREIKGDEVLATYQPSLEKEYQFWMNGADQVSASNPAVHRVVRLDGNIVLNRYWDENNTPRPESYREDIETAHESALDAATVYRHLRAAAESGWDFSSRWLADGQHLHSIRTTDLIPVDLNALLYDLENTLAEACLVCGKNEQSAFYQIAAQQRKRALLQYCWDDSKGFFTDFDYVQRQSTGHLTLAATFPLFFGMATTEQAAAVASIIEQQFLKPGGLATTLLDTGQQWDAPNGWAPLQWIAFKGLQRYGFDALAGTIRQRWMHANEVIYQHTGKMTEKYNVVEQNAAAGGGEYPLQDGFGWTNGVYLAFHQTNP